MPASIVVETPRFDPIVGSGIGGIAVIMAISCVVVYSGGDRRRGLALALGFLVWMSLWAVLAGLGILARFDIVPPPGLLMFVGLFGVAFGVGLSPLGRTLTCSTSLVALVGLQSFRFPLELVMHHAVNQKIMPNALSYSGYNFDIVTGVGALVLWVLMACKVQVPTKVVWAWNVWGWYCLVAIGVIAISSSPMIRAFGDDPAKINSWVLYFPYVWLPTVLVTIAIIGHILVTRKLLLGRGS